MISPKECKVILIEALGTVLPPFPEPLQKYAEKSLREMGVDVRLNTAVKGVTKAEDNGTATDLIQLGDGSTIPMFTLFWAAGVKAAPLAEALDVPKQRGGRIPVDENWQIAGKEGAFVVGDMAWYEEGGKPLPGVAPVAAQGGEYVAKYILSKEKGLPVKPFKYFDKGKMAIIARKRAVAETGPSMGSKRMTGLTAWVAWLGVHVALMAGFRNRVVTIINWVWDYALMDRQLRLITKEADAERKQTYAFPSTALRRRSRRRCRAARSRPAPRCRRPSARSAAEREAEVKAASTCESKCLPLLFLWGQGHAQVLVSAMNLQTELYLAQRQIWPREGRHILAQFDDDSIIVYQAYRPATGHFAAQNQRFGGEWSLSRMSWIKPNFLWMMYRSGWGAKENQEVTLAVRLKRGFFERVLEQAVPSSFDARLFEDEAAWKRAVAASNVRLQWDPDHSPSGGALARRAIQLGLRGPVLAEYASEAIVEIEDISAFVAVQRERVAADELEHLTTPRERVFVSGKAEVAQRLGLNSA
jgi:hypothetical protein